MPPMLSPVAAAAAPAWASPRRASSHSPLALSSLLHHVSSAEGGEEEETSTEAQEDTETTRQETRQQAESTVGQGIAALVLRTVSRAPRPRGFWLPWGARSAPPALPAPPESALEAAENAGSGRRFSVGEGIDIRRFLRPVSTPELVQVRKFASLSAFAYLIESVTERALAKSHKLKLVKTSLAKRLEEARPVLDRTWLAEALLAAPAAPPRRPAPPPLALMPPGGSHHTILPAALVAQPQPNALTSYLPSDTPTTEAQPQSEAERALNKAVADILQLATTEQAEVDAAAAAQPAVLSGLLWPLRQRPVVSAAKRAARVARNVTRPAAQALSAPVSTASTYVANLASAAMPLITAATSGSSAAATALASAAGLLAATAATGSSVAAQALGGMIDPIAATAAAGGSVAGSTLASITGSIAAAAASAATRVTGPRSRKVSEAVESAVEIAQAQLSSQGGAVLAAAALQMASSVTKSSTRISCPCEWFVADEESSKTRVFVIQGSDSAASWRSNLAFDPVVFEDPQLNTKVHRGVYEAACALYDTLSPLIDDHLGAHRRGSARLAFTGHSLGGSLATLMLLMLSHRRPELASALEPVYTFGAPSIFADDCCIDGAQTRAATRARRAASAGGSDDGSLGCRGVLSMLGLPRNHVRNVMMHLDIVPRAFACDYSMVQAWLRRIGGGFREVRSLQGDENVSLYLPTGITLVMQPKEDVSAQHAMLPPGSGIYLLDDPQEPFWAAVGVPWGLGGNGGGSGTDGDAYEEEGEGTGAAPDARAALSALLNSPHPLDILADVAAYGPQGTVSLYHNPFNYVRCLANEQRRRKEWRKPLDTGAVRLAGAMGGVLNALRAQRLRRRLVSVPAPAPVVREAVEDDDEEPDLTPLQALKP